MTKKRIPPSNRPLVGQSSQNTAAIFHEIFVNIRQRQYDRAHLRLEQTRRRDLTPAELATAQRLRAEIKLQAALVAPDLDLRLQQITDALAETPGAPRLRFYAGLTLWNLGRRPEALAEWEDIAAARPQWPGLAFLCQLGRLTLGQPWQTESLSPAEANTLRLVDAFLKGRQADISAAGKATDALIGPAPELWQTLIDLSQPERGPVVPAPSRAAAPFRAADPVIAAIRDYYAGVAAQRAGQSATARTSWQRAAGAEWSSPWLQHNLKASARQMAVALAEQQQWGKIIQLAPPPGGQPADDAILDETIALAYDHLGFAAATSQRWETAALHWTAANDLAGSRRLAQNLALASETAGRWAEAAQAWREMVRRRPRKPDHPDYLDDGQVAAIWRHAALCYLQEDDLAEAITCLKHASNYAGDDLDIRLALAQALVDNEQTAAAENEVDRVLALAPDNIEGLRLRGHFNSGRWDRDAKPVWRRILELEPNDPEAKEALAQSYLVSVRFENFTPAQKVAFFTQALNEVPQHPRLLLELGKSHAANGQRDLAIACFRQAWQTDPASAELAGDVIHELLHLQAGDVLSELLPQIRQIDGLLPGFWLSAVERVLRCKLDDEWADHFIAEALTLTSQPYVDLTPAFVLARACSILIAAKKMAHADKYLAQLRTQAPRSGAVEYVESRLAAIQGDRPRAIRLVAAARRLARRAHETALLDLIANEEASPFPGGLPPSPDDFLRILRDVFPDGPPDARAMKRLLDEFTTP